MSISAKDLRSPEVIIIRDSHEDSREIDRKICGLAALTIWGCGGIGGAITSCVLRSAVPLGLGCAVGGGAALIGTYSNVVIQSCCKEK